MYREVSEMLLLISARIGSLQEDMQSMCVYAVDLFPGVESSTEKYKYYVHLLYES